jgi:hypothetical protein
VGNLFVTTIEGGAGVCLQEVGCGTVVKLSPTNSGTYQMQVLYVFTGGEDGGGADGGRDPRFAGKSLRHGLPRGSFTNCYSGCGTIFKMSPASIKYGFSVLYSFQSTSDGDAPETSLIFDSSGSLYGIGAGNSSGHGCCESGFVFKLTPVGDGRWSESMVHAFRPHADGGRPYSYNGIVLDAAGDILGTLPDYGTKGGCGKNYGDGCGVAYELTP